MTKLVEPTGSTTTTTTPATTTQSTNQPPLMDLHNDMLEIPSSRSGSRHETSRKEQVGVADYFAVLGIGDTLEWKHAPMLHPPPNTNLNTMSTPFTTRMEDDDDDLPAASAVATEDDAKMLEILP